MRCPVRSGGPHFRGLGVQGFGALHENIQHQSLFPSGQRVTVPYVVFVVHTHPMFGSSSQVVFCFMHSRTSAIQPSAGRGAEPPRSEEDENRRLEAKSREHNTIQRDFFMEITSRLVLLPVGKTLASFTVKKKKTECQPVFLASPPIVGCQGPGPQQSLSANRGVMPAGVLG